MTTTFRKVLILTGLAGVVALGTGYYLWTKKPENLLHAKAAASLDASALMDAFRSDVAAAGTKYNGQNIQVGGKIAEISKNETGDLTVFLETASGGKIICEFDRMYKVEDTGYQAGQRISVKGECTGYDDLFGDVKLSRCQPVR